MNLPKFFNRWWLMLAHGILLIFLSYFLFSNPSHQLSTSGTVVGFIALLTGSVSINGYFLTGGNHKSGLELLCGIFSWITGLFFLSGIQISQEITNWLFLAYMIVNASILANAAWYLKAEINWWWLTVIHLFYTLLVGYFLLSVTTVFYLPVTVFIGIQVITNGLLMIVFAFVLRKIQLEYSKTVRQIRENQEELFK